MLLYPNKLLNSGLDHRDEYQFVREAPFNWSLVNYPSVFKYAEELYIHNQGLEHLQNGFLAAQPIQQTNQNSSLVNTLRQGGYILYARHGEATVGRDQANLHFNYCFTQRNLSKFGKIQAITFGQTIRGLGIPIQYPVIASPFCRTRETAELAFGRENVQVDPFWVKVYKLSGDVRSGEQRRIIDSINTALEAKPIPGYNKVIIAHSFPGNNGLGEIPDMGTIVLKPYGEGNGYEIIARVSLPR